METQCWCLCTFSPAYVLEIIPWQSPEVEFLKNILHQIRDSNIHIFMASRSYLKTYPMSEEQTYVTNSVEYVQLHTADTQYRLAHNAFAYKTPKTSIQKFIAAFCFS